MIVSSLLKYTVLNNLTYDLLTHNQNKYTNKYSASTLFNWKHPFRIALIYKYLSLTHILNLLAFNFGDGHRFKHYEHRTCFVGLLWWSIDWTLSMMQMPLIVLVQPSRPSCSSKMLELNSVLFQIKLTRKLLRIELTSCNWSERGNVLLVYPK